MKNRVFQIIFGVALTGILITTLALKNGNKTAIKNGQEYRAIKDTKSSLDYIDPTIGYKPQLLWPTYPFACLPNEMIRVFSPRQHYADKTIANFPLSIISYFGAKVFAVKPWTGKIDSSAWVTQLASDHDHEAWHPWYFTFSLTNNNVKVEFTPGSKSGFYRFTFPENMPKQILFDVYNNGLCKWSFNSNEISGMESYGSNVKVYMYGIFNMMGSTAIFNNNNQQQKGNSATGQALKSYISFPQKSQNIVEFKYALSFVSEEQARNNLNNEVRNKTFNQMTADAKNAWAKVMNRIQVEGGTEAQKAVFYTALYRCYQRMVNISEDGSYYSPYNNQINKDTRPFYVDDWVWDTYLALHPLRMILNPSLEEDMLQSYVRMYKQSGAMPTFPLIIGDARSMNGYHSTILFLDAYRKGLRNFDVQTAYDGAKKNATSFTSLPWKTGAFTSLDNFYQKNGYMPALKPGEKETFADVNPSERRQSVAVTLANSYDDWALAQMARELNKSNDYNSFIQRSKNYKNLWNDKRKFFLPKDASGNWIDIDPTLGGGQGGRDYYAENNGWTYLWQVPEDIPSLIDLMGGQKAFENRLDTMFNGELGVPQDVFLKQFPDATGLVGHFSMGNEPSFLIPYLYNYADAPWKTQTRIRFILERFFTNKVDGVPGDEDGGAMSAFVVLSYMGFYQVTPGIPIYTIGSPVFSKITLLLPNNKQFTIIAKNNSNNNMYIQNAKLNGKPLDFPWFTHRQLVAGGTLELTMGSNPNKQWGKGGLQEFEKMSQPYE